LHFVDYLKLPKSGGSHIAENGALVIDGAGNVIERIQIPQKTALTVWKLADAEGFAVQKYEGDTIFISRRNEFTDYDQKLTGLKQEIPEDFMKLVESGCTKLLIPGDPMILKPLEALLRAVIGTDATLFTSKPYFLEILPPNTDKGTALAGIARLMGVKREEVMALGDSMNDRAMISWAGTGVAMKNGDERVKKIAQLVTESTNNDDGVAKTIEEYVLKGKALLR
jgi:Cof subfamily protein (haloacid dehalogenase superfamily)